MISQKMPCSFQLFLFLIASLSVYQSATAVPFKNLYPTPDPDLLVLTSEDEMYVQNLFDQFNLTIEERAQLTHLINPTVSGLIENFDLSRDPEALIPMEQHLEYIELMGRIATLPGIPVNSCSETLLGGGYYYLEGDISCILATNSDVGIFVGAGAILDMRGYSVTGTGAGTGVGIGIQLDEKASLLGGLSSGLVSHFHTGIYSESNSNLVLHVESSHNNAEGILIEETFLDSDTNHYFNNHRILYSIANKNGGFGIALQTFDENLNVKGDISIFGNVVYGSVANGNGLNGILMDYHATSHHYDNVNVYRNGISHSQALDNGIAGILLEVANFQDVNKGGISVRENNLSHNEVSCASIGSCHSNVGLGFYVIDVSDIHQSGIDVLDNIITSNHVDNSAGMGVFFKVDSSQESGAGSINFERNEMTFNRAEHNVDGIDMFVTNLQESNSGNINIKDNLIAFNRGAYSTGDEDVFQGNGIFVNFTCLKEKGKGALEISDNLIFANVAYQNPGAGVFFSASPGCPADKSSQEKSVERDSLFTNTAKFINNRMLFNQTSSNDSPGVLLLSIFFKHSESVEASNNRVSFNRDIGSDTGIGFTIEGYALGVARHSSKVIDNQADHNITADNTIGMLFLVESRHDTGHADTSYRNRAESNFIHGSLDTGILVLYVKSVDYPDKSDKNGLFKNLIIESDIGIAMGEGSHNVVNRNYVTNSGIAGIIVGNHHDEITENISILSGQYNLHDVAGEVNSTHCNTWKHNTYYGIQGGKVFPPICFETKS